MLTSWNVLVLALLSSRRARMSNPHILGTSRSVMITLPDVNTWTINKKKLSNEISFFLDLWNAKIHFTPYT